jgi:hypothetical protein
VVQLLIEFFLAMGLDAIRHGILHEIIGKRGHKTIFLSGLEGGTLQVQILSRRALCLVSIVLWDVLWTAPHSYGVAAAQEEEINQVVHSSIPCFFLAAFTRSAGQ